MTRYFSGQNSGDYMEDGLAWGRGWQQETVEKLLPTKGEGWEGLVKGSDCGNREGRLDLRRLRSIGRKFSHSPTVYFSCILEM